MITCQWPCVSRSNVVYIVVTSDKWYYIAIWYIYIYINSNCFCCESTFFLVASCTPKRVRLVTETSAIVGWIQSDSFRALWRNTAGQFKVLAAILCGTWRNHLQMLGLSQEECGSLWSPGESCNAAGIGAGGMVMCQCGGCRSNFAGWQM